jgi:hypothetical protein
MSCLHWTQARCPSKVLWPTSRMRLVEFMSLHIVAYLTMIVLLFFQLYIQFNNIHLWLFGQVNNAGVGGISNEVELSVTTLDTNYFGVKNVTKALLPLLRDSPAGPRIVNVSSMVGALEVIHQPYSSPLHSNALKYRREGTLFHLYKCRNAISMWGFNRVSTIVGWTYGKTRGKHYEILSK